jgi:hypothetical protein
MATVRFTGCGTGIGRGLRFLPSPSSQGETLATEPSSLRPTMTPTFCDEYPNGGASGSRS